MREPAAATEYLSTLRAAASELARARRVLAITGAGISADSGLPTYRGAGGLYDETLTEDGISIEEALSGAMLRRRPEVTWKHLLHIAKACDGRAPNAGHLALAEMERHFPQFTLLTQNVDGLHHAAGSRRVIEIHGNLRELHCMRCGYSADAPAPASLDGPPICPGCASTLRPGIVLFGEALPRQAVGDLEAALQTGVDFVMIIGTSAGFPYIAGPVAQAARAGLPTLEINSARSEVSYLVRHRLKLRAAEALPALWALVRPQPSPVAWPAY